MKTLSLDLRERILASYDAHEGTRAEVAMRFRVSLGMVKKLLKQRRHTGDIHPQHHRAGRKPKILAKHRQRFQRLLARRPDLTLKQLRQAVGLTCSLPASAEGTLRRHLQAIWVDAALWNDDKFLNWVAFDAATCIGHIIELGVPPAEFEDQVRRLSRHVCGRNQESCRHFLSKHYTWLQ